MKKHIKKFTVFSKNIGKGLNVEFKETIEIPSLIRRKEYKKAGAQVVDLFKMTGLTIVWIIPGGAVLTTMILKFSHKSRPSAFQSNAEEGSLGSKEPDTLNGTVESSQK
ncbi:hypothetical protein YH65_04895 [Sulfurovum lithotrophicum]|uniref:Uncharacterized protein n=1 Tax=Sulfurovum lithotrophicum TaxID=206403 RepID=A0A7U4RQE3_9BACT|nr:hypothetical protein [Sulfurovum lithotrophicum]AKF24793.1 hypothetical protein YH65_04895 [Sulfurovum lithotrophicum]